MSTIKKKEEKVRLGRSTIPKAGRGVFAIKIIQREEVIEKCPIIKLSNEAHSLKKSKLYNYYFLWGKNHKNAAIALGLGSIYNHSYEPNATYKKDLRHQTITFSAIKKIWPGEEITVNYNYGDPKDKSPLWFKI